MAKNYDFSGWASRHDIKCSDGRTIKQGAFKDQDGQKVPLVWNHGHKEASDVLGHALLENRKEGVYVYGSFNTTEEGVRAKELVQHGDITALSIYANKLKENGGNVIHGFIREVSLVLAGANPGAYIETIIAHSDNGDEEAVIYNPSEDLEIIHSEEENPAEEIKGKTDDKKEKNESKKEDNMDDKKDLKHKDGEAEKTIQDVFDTFSEEQKNVVYAMIGLALDENKSIEQGDDEMKQNAFDTNNNENKKDVLSHAEVLAIIDEAKKTGSLKEVALAHGITDIEVLYPEVRNVTPTPETIKEDDAWVKVVMNGVKKSPFSRIKSTAVDITEDEARARGYIKGKQKKEEVFKAMKRTTTPTTVYKLQKIDRDDVIDITDFDVIAFIKAEMRVKLNEELARAFLLSDGRDSSDESKINEGNIRPILGDDPLYTIPKIITVKAGMTDDDLAKEYIKTVIKSRLDYKGSGNPSLFMTEDMLVNMLLLTDGIGRDLYDNVDKLKTKLRVKEIVTVPQMRDAVRMNDAETKDFFCVGILVNLNDYTSGATRGGEVNFFDDFDLNFNKYEYLIETRCSGALTKPHSAISFELEKDHVAG